MAGTRTAPAMTASATGRSLTLSLIDASGDVYSENVPVPVAATAAQLEAIANNYALSSNASLYSAIDNVERIGDADPDNATAEYRASVADGINLGFKNPATKQARGVRVIAPIDTILQGNQDIPLLVAPLSDLVTALLAVLTGMSATAAQFTTRRERKNNPKVKL